MVKSNVFSSRLRFRKNVKQVTDVISDLANVATKEKQILLPY